MSLLSNNKVNFYKNEKVLKDDRCITSNCEGAKKERLNTSNTNALRDEIIQRAELERNSRPPIDITERYGYVYLTENLVNGKLYIGQHQKNYFDDKYFGSGVYILRALSKYGTSNFKSYLLLWGSCIDDINSIEKLFIKEFNAVKSNVFYNMAPGGYGNGSGKDCVVYGTHMSKESKEKLSKSLKEYYNTTRFNKVERSNNIKKSLNDYYSTHSGNNKGRTFGSVARKNMSLAHIRYYENNPNGVRKGWHHSEETKKKISDKAKLIKNPAGNAKKVVCIENGKVFNTIDEASKYCKSYHVSDVLHGRRKKAGGYHWKYYEDNK